MAATAAVKNGIGHDGTAGALGNIANGPESPRQGQTSPRQVEHPQQDGSGEQSRKYPFPFQSAASQCYNSTHVQVCVAFLIIANFVTNMTEKQIDPDGEKYETVWSAFDLAYNIIFTVELLCNLYAHWWWEFWESPWNIFDVVVVTIGIVSMMRLPLPYAFGLLRMMRAFRVFRLFKRVKSLNKIIVAIIKAVPGVVNAFIILTIVISIYAILGVEFYRDIGGNCKNPDFTRKGYETARLAPNTMCVGPEYFGSFLKSWYTHFQILTGESWSEAIGRPVIWSYDDEDWFFSLASTFFFVSFIIVTSFVLMNVVVAVLLDKMQASSEPPPLMGADLEMLRRYEKLSQVLTKLGERMQNTEDELTNVQSDMDSFKEEIDKANALVDANQKYLGGKASI